MLSQPSIFMERMIRFLLPYFTTITPDLALARADILETLASYGARTRAEMLNAAQIVAFGFAALDTLEEANTAELSPSMRLRHRGCANNLNRSCQLSEKALARQLSREVSKPEPIGEPIDDIPEADAAAIIRLAQATIDAHRNDRLAASHPATVPHALAASNQERHNRLWGGAMMDALAGMGMPVQPVPAAESSAPT